jgi:hypothetical protein
LLLSNFKDLNQEENGGAHDRELAPAHNRDTLNYKDDNAAPPTKRKQVLSSKAGAKMASCKDNMLDSGTLDKDTLPNNIACCLSSEHPAETLQAGKHDKQRKALTQKNTGKAAWIPNHKADLVLNKSSAYTEQQRKLQSRAK